MPPSGSEEASTIFDALEIEYEKAYGNNPFKIAAVKHAMNLFPPASKILDIGCGTGSPVIEILSAADADHQITGFDVSAKMVELTRSRYKAAFTVADMLDFPTEERQYDAIFMIFSHLHLSYSQIWKMMYKYAKALDEEGLFVLGQMPADTYVTDESEYADWTKSYVENYDLPFMGGTHKGFMMTVKGQRQFLESMGMDVLYETVDSFQPESEKCRPEEQQYLIARRRKGVDVMFGRPIPRLKDV